MRVREPVVLGGTGQRPGGHADARREVGTPGIGEHLLQDVDGFQIPGELDGGGVRVSRIGEQVAGAVGVIENVGHGCVLADPGEDGAQFASQTRAIGIARTTCEDLFQDGQGLVALHRDQDLAQGIASSIGCVGATVQGGDALQVLARIGECAQPLIEPGPHLQRRTGQLLTLARP